MTQRLIELSTKQGAVLVKANAPAYPMRHYADARLKAAVGRFLQRHQLRQGHGESLDSLAGRVKSVLQEPSGQGPILDCLRGKMLIVHSGEKLRKVEGVLILVVQNGGAEPLYLFGPWLWFGECVRVSRRSRARR